MNKIYWLTGQPGAGKTTLGKLLVEKVENAIQLDGDELRSITQNNDYSEKGRRENIKLAQMTALNWYCNGKNVIVSLVSPYKDQRDDFKKICRLIEIYVFTTEDRGRTKFQVLNYQPPTEQYVNIDTTNKTPQESFNELLKKIEEIDDFQRCC